MNIEKRNNYTYISTDEMSSKDFFKALIHNHKNLEKTHLIINLSDGKNISKEEVLLLLDMAYQHKKNGTTFVVVSKEIDIDLFSEGFNIVPTLTEAEDVLEIENIERELGF